MFPRNSKPLTLVLCKFWFAVACGKRSANGFWFKSAAVKVPKRPDKLD